MSKPRSKKAPAKKAKPKPKRDRYGFQSPVVEARTSPVVHWRCDVCRFVKESPRELGRPTGWIDVKVFGLGANNYVTRCCPECATHAALFTSEDRRLQPVLG